MKTYHFNPFHMCNSFIALVLLFSFVGVKPVVADSSPWISVWIPQEVHGYNWPTGATVTLTIAHADSQNTPYYSDTTNPTPPPNLPLESWFAFHIPEPLTIQTGDIVTVSNGTQTKTHVVKFAQITQVDTSTNQISGKTDPNSKVIVSVASAFGYEQHANRTIYSNGSGDWVADFSSPGTRPDEQNTVDITETNWGWTNIPDEDNDSTTIKWDHLRNIWVRLDNPGGASGREIDGFGWPLNIPVTLTVDDPATPESPDHSQTLTNTNPNLPLFFNLDYNVYPGYFITMTDGIVTKTHTVRNPSISNVDLATNQVTGTATPGSRIWIGTRGTQREVYADEYGNWVADFSVDIKPGDTVEAREYDQDTDLTLVYIQIPNPYFVVRANQDVVGAREWAIGDTLTVSIDNPSTPDNPDYTTSKTVTSTDQLRFALSGVYDIRPDDMVSVSNGWITKTTIVTNLAITELDVDTDIVSGIAAPASRIDVWACDENSNCINRHVNADQNGNWLADFAHPGSASDEQNTFNIIPGTVVDSRQIDEDGDLTRFGQNVPVPAPVIWAHPNDSEEDWIDARDWGFGEMLHLTIDNDADPSNGVLYTDSGVVGPANWDPSVGDKEFHLGNFDLKSGHIVTVTSPTTTKILVITDLDVTDINPNLDTISGTAAVGSAVQAWFHEEHTCNFEIYTDGNGIWTVDFNPCDIRPAVGGGIGQKDADDDSTVYFWRVPNPYFVVRTNSDQVEAWEWPIGETLTLSIDNPNTTDNPDYTTAKTVQGAAPWDPSRTYVSFDLGGIYDIKPGDQASVSNGTITKTTVVTNLAFTAFNVDADTVSGTAASGSRVDLWACDNNSNCVNRHANVNQSGNWSADFAHPGIEDDEQNTFDIVGGIWVDSQQNDDDGDGTSFGQNVPNVPNPRFNADLEENKVYGIEWPDGTPVTLTVDDPATLPNPDFTSTQVAHVNSQARYQADVIFDPNGLRLQSGMLVTMTDGTTTKAHTIPGFSWTAIDYAADVVSGTANPGMDTYVWVGEVARGFLPEPDGNWTASFAIPGDQSWETILDIRPGMSGGMAQVDSDGDITLINWPDISMAIKHSPAITSVTAPLNPVQLGQSINATVTFSDPDVGDTHTVTWDWGDGATTTASASVLSVTTPHTYASPGVYTITATVTDAAGASALAAYQFVVIYDPNGGYVTGGGWIMSPAGAYFANPTLTGKATFGFVSKYQKGADVPTGNTEFQFQIANLNFKSTSYDWLVIAGKKAQYKGTGTINGSGNYGFMLTAIDDTLDKFRIKIWDKANGDLVYDNQLGAADTADPVTVIGGGSIVIHKEK